MVQFQLLLPILMEVLSIIVGLLLLQATTSSFDCDDLGANTVRLFGFDNLDLAIANIGFCDATVTVVDLLPPSIAGMPSSQTLNVVSGTCGAVANMDCSNRIR